LKKTLSLLNNASLKFCCEEANPLMLKVSGEGDPIKGVKLCGENVKKLN
jgi:hypothetical protein